MRGMIAMKIIKNENGQALVEFAIILPILLLLIMGIFEFGMLLNSYLTIQNAAREGARLGIVGGTDVEIDSLINSISPTLTPSDLTVSVTPVEISRNSGDTLTVNVTYNYHMTVPIISALLNNVVPLKAQTSMRIE
jgi:Flp pilus assembly protein TadG